MTEEPQDAVTVLACLVDVAREKRLGVLRQLDRPLRLHQPADCRQPAGNEATGQITM